MKSVFGRTLLTPDAVRGKRSTLRAAVLKTGWPTLAKARGKVVVVLNAADAVAAAYTTGAPSLQGKAMFMVGAPTDAWAAVISRDAVTPKAFTALVKQHFVVRTLADVDSKEARANDPTRANAAIASGATIVATDFPVADPAIGPYVVDLPGTAVARCNPVTAPKRCKDSALE